MADVYVTVKEGEADRTSVELDGVHFDQSTQDELLGIEVLGAHDVAVDGFSCAEMREILAVIYLYVPWRYVTKQLTTEQKNLWADVIDAHSQEVFPDDPIYVSRWWQE